MSDLRGMKNIGAIVAAELEKAGVRDSEALRNLGAIHAAIQLRAAGFDVCVCKLSGLEGAIRDIKWNLIPPEERRTLWKQFAELTHE